MKFKISSKGALAPWRVLIARAYNGGLKVQLHWGPKAEPLVRRLGSEALLKLMHFGFLDVQWKPQICRLF